MLLSITSGQPQSLPSTIHGFHASLSNSQTILTSSNNQHFYKKSKKTSVSIISCGVTQTNQFEFSASWKSLRTPHASSFPNLITQKVHVGRVSKENAAETNTYTVLALPPKNVTENLEQVMKILRSEYGGPELIKPHFAVVGPNEQTDDTDAINKFRAACKGVKPYYATVGSIETGPSFYQCVFCFLQKSDEVLETAAHCSKFFGDDIENPWLRHVSLIFGDFTDEMKQKIKKRAEDLCPDLTSLSFQTSKLVLYRINMNDKTLKSWKQVDEYNLI